MVKYSHQYICKPTSEVKEGSYLSKSDICNSLKELMKKIKNANVQDKFYQASMGMAMDKSTMDTSKFSSKLSFEADTMSITPFDFIRVVFVFSADQVYHKLLSSLHIIAPNLSYKFEAIPKMRLVSTPLSRLLIGKLSQDDKANIQTNFK